MTRTNSQRLDEEEMLNKETYDHPHPSECLQIVLYSCLK